MLQGKKLPAGGLILAGLAAYAYYKYSRMSEEQKQNLVNDLKEKGKRYFDQYMPEELKNIFPQKKQLGDVAMTDAENMGI